MQRFLLLLWLLFLVVDKIQCEDIDDTDNLCNIYLAPTSIKGAQGCLGVFTTRSFADNELVLAADGPNIPISDPFEKRGQWTKLFQRYWWEHGGSDQVMREAHKGLDYQITFGALPNHHSQLENLDPALAFPPYDDSPSAQQHVGVGAFSYYQGRDFRAKRPIKAGEELFLDYGHANWPGGEHVPLKDDYNEAGAFLCDTFHDGGEWDFALLKEAQASLENPKAVAALPQTREDFQLLIEKFPTWADLCQQKDDDEDDADPGFHLAQQLSVEPKSIDWIRANGVCLDNIVPGPSTIPEAGQGAIASRAIPQGDIIVPVPFLHVTDSPSNMKYRVWNEEDGNQVLHEQTQLLVNYCFGHHESSLLLCPETNANLINHCSNRAANTQDCQPNAEYQWASGWDPDTEAWKQMSLDELAKHWSRGLSFEIVATRDIQKGEEIFMDYGQHWEEAWNNHVDGWIPPSHEVYSTTLLNEEEEIPYEFMTHDLRNDIWPHTDSLITDCVYWEHLDIQYEMAGFWLLHRMIPNGRYAQDPWMEELSDDEILEFYGIDGRDYILPQDQDGSDGNWYWPCQVVWKQEELLFPNNNNNQDDDHEREENKTTDNDDDETYYTVRIFQSRFQESMWWNERDIPRFVANMPRSSIRFIHEPYKSDMHYQGAFRHFIEIRDEIFPDAWKDFANNDNDSSTTTGDEQPQPQHEQPQPQQENVSFLEL